MEQQYFAFGSCCHTRSCLHAWALEEDEDEGGTDEEEEEEEEEEGEGGGDARVTSSRLGKLPTLLHFLAYATASSKPSLGGGRAREAGDGRRLYRGGEDEEGNEAVQGSPAVNDDGPVSLFLSASECE